MDLTVPGTSALVGAGTLDRAVLATDVSFTLVDARLPDAPLAWVNPAFTEMTGYSFDESVGRNCRFLQGPATDSGQACSIGKALANGQRVAATLLNYRRDGSTFWNDLTINPVVDDAGQLTHFVGLQVDVTARVEVSAARDRALLAEHEAAVRATTAQAGLELLAAASNELALSFSGDDSLDRLASLVVPTLADWVVIHRVDGRGSFCAPPFVRHRDGREELAARYAELLPTVMTDSGPLHRLVSTGRSWMASEFDPADAATWSTGTELAAIRTQLGLASTMFIALPGRQGVVGTMVLNRGRHSPRFDASDYRLAVDLGRRAGLTLDNARLYQNERHVAETLQRSLLPTLPRVDGLEIAARYNAAQDGVQVGGDFYDVLELPNGRTGIVIGDVGGHDIHAAAAMGRLRGLIQAVLFDSSLADQIDAPDVVLQRVDRLVQCFATVPLATVAYAELESTAPGRPQKLRYASAGHPLLLVREPNGSARFCTGEPGLLLGVDVATRVTYEEMIEPGSTLLAFTDGLVERRGADLDDGLELLRLLVENTPTAIGPEELCDRLVEWLGDSEDDTALLAIRTS